MKRWSKNEVRRKGGKRLPRQVQDPALVLAFKVTSVIHHGMSWVALGAFNSSNLQLANSSMEHNPIYDADKGFKVMPSSFHDIGDVEFQDNWGRVWVDLGTSDIFAVDVLLNCLTVLSSEYLGIQQMVFGGRRMGDWEEGMTNPEYGYKYFKI
ncbi:hypothetical protein IFM89_024967 [Coptis chinensis]|uniref:Uncharacterized protein n=1 Tax=Coptis chinensis TaxID=261450 RepID=A0A835HW45_9MAGN|nr:hypothetical protein IFM89_024967 [Coptis chinensis]